MKKQFTSYIIMKEPFKCSANSNQAKIRQSNKAHHRSDHILPQSKKGKQLQPRIATTLKRTSWSNCSIKKLVNELAYKTRKNHTIRWIISSGEDCTFRITILTKKANGLSKAKRMMKLSCSPRDNCMSKGLRRKWGSTRCWLATNWSQSRRRFDHMCVMIVIIVT